MLVVCVCLDLSYHLSTLSPMSTHYPPPFHPLRMTADLDMTPKGWFDRLANLGGGDGKLSAESAATIIRYGLERDRALIAFPFSTYLVVSVVAKLPVSVQLWLAKSAWIAGSIPGDELGPYASVAATTATATATGRQ